jgi:hypothetical protein
VPNWSLLRRHTPAAVTSLSASVYYSYWKRRAAVFSTVLLVQARRQTGRAAGLLQHVLRPRCRLLSTTPALSLGSHCGAAPRLRWWCRAHSDLVVSYADSLIEQLVEENKMFWATPMQTNTKLQVLRKIFCCIRLCTTQTYNAPTHVVGVLLYLDMQLNNRLACLVDDLAWECWPCR